MDDRSISARNLAYYLALMTTSSLLVTGFGKVKQDFWISTLAASLGAVPLLALYARIASLHPGQSVFEMVDGLFGKVARALLLLLLSWYGLHVSALVAQNFSLFVSTIALQKTPRAFIFIPMIGVSAYLGQGSFKTLGRWAAIVLITITFNLIITFGCSLRFFNLSNLKPVLEHGVGELLSSGHTLGVIAFGENFLLLAATGALKRHESPYRAFLGGVGLGTVFLLAVVLRNTLVLGKAMLDTALYPSFITARIVNPGAFLEHIENLVSFNLIFLGLSKCALGLKFATMGTAKLLGLQGEEKRLTIPIALLSIAVCATSFANMQGLIEFMDSYRFYALLPCLLVPLLLLVRSEIARQRKRTA